MWLEARELVVEGVRKDTETPGQGGLEGREGQVSRPDSPDIFPEARTACSLPPSFTPHRHL